MLQEKWHVVSVFVATTTDVSLFLLFIEFFSAYKVRDIIEIIITFLLLGFVNELVFWQ